MGRLLRASVEEQEILLLTRVHRRGRLPQAQKLVTSVLGGFELILHHCCAIGG